MKNFLVFFGMFYYPCGGFNDFDKDFDTLDEAIQFIQNKLNNDIALDKSDYWYHVFSLKDKAIVYNYKNA